MNLGRLVGVYIITWTHTQDTMTQSSRPTIGREACRNSEMREDGGEQHAKAYVRIEEEFAQSLGDHHDEAGMKGSSKVALNRHPSSPRFSTSVFGSHTSAGMPAIALVVAPVVAPAAHQAPWATSPQHAAEWCREHPPDVDIDDDDWSSDWDVPHLGVRLEDTDFLSELAREATQLLADFE